MALVRKKKTAADYVYSLDDLYRGLRKGYFVSSILEELC